MPKQDMFVLDMPRLPSKAVRLKAFKREHGILTHRTPGLEREDNPWMALIPSEEDMGKDLVKIMAESCRLYDEAGWIGYGAGELSAVRELCEKRGIACEI